MSYSVDHYEEQKICHLKAIAAAVERLVATTDRLAIAAEVLAEASKSANIAVEGLGELHDAR